MNKLKLSAQPRDVRITLTFDLQKWKESNVGFGPNTCRTCTHDHRPLDVTVKLAFQNSQLTQSTARQCVFRADNASARIHFTPPISFPGITLS